MKIEDQSLEDFLKTLELLHETTMLNSDKKVWYFLFNGEQCSGHISHTSGITLTRTLKVQTLSSKDDIGKGAGMPVYLNFRMQEPEPMNQLENLRNLGVTTLSVQNNLATAVNPYEKTDPFGPEWNNFEDLALPPLPCPSVPDGTYEIGRFSESSYFYADAFTHKYCLVLSEPVAESEKSIVAESGKAIEVAEKPEGEIPKNLPDVELVAAKVHDAWWAAKAENGFHAPVDCRSENSLSYVRSPQHGQDRFDDHFDQKFYKWCDKCHPDMYPYSDLSETVKDYDRTTVKAVYAAIESVTPPEAQPVVSAEENKLYSIIEQREELIGELIKRNKKLEKELREYASLRVAQEKAELIEKLERMKDDSGREGCTYGDTDYDSQSVVYGYNLAIDDLIRVAQALKK